MCVYLICEVNSIGISSIKPIYVPIYSKLFKPQRSWSVVDPIISLFKTLFGNGSHSNSNSSEAKSGYVYIKPVKRKRVKQVNKLQMVRIIYMSCVYCIYMCIGKYIDT